MTNDFCNECRCKVDSSGYCLNEIKSHDNNPKYEKRPCHNFKRCGNYVDGMDSVCESCSRDQFIQPADYGGCFIATACYGSSLHPDLDVLRSFRDKCLPTLLVRFYYSVSPPIADFIASKNILKKILRNLFLKPVIKFLRGRIPI